MRKHLNQSSILTITLLIVIFDQATKFFAWNHLINSVPKILIPNIVQLRLARNTGAAFSLFSENTLSLAIISLIVSSILLTWILQNSRMHIWKGLAIATLLGGSIGNGLDRWRVGFVTDFLELIPINFPIFNIADISINCAIIFFLIDNISSKEKRTQNN